MDYQLVRTCHSTLVGVEDNKTDFDDIGFIETLIVKLQDQLGARCVTNEARNKMIVKMAT